MKILVLGAGSIGRRHLANLRSLGVSKLAVYDPDAAARSKAATEFGAEAFENYERALDWKPDSALVCTPNSLHLKQAQDILSRDAHVFIEKPLAISREGLPELARAAERSKKAAMVGYCMRFHPAVKRVKEALEEGMAGDPWIIRVRFSHYLPNWRPGQDYRSTYSAHAGQGGGILFDAIHDIDMLLWWMNRAPSRVQGWAARVSDLETDAEDAAAVLVDFPGKAAGEVRLDYLRHEKLREAEIIGPKGVLAWSGVGRSPEAVTARFFDKNERRWTTLYENPSYDANEQYVEEMKHFLACARGIEAPRAGIEDGIRSLEVVLDAKEALAAGEKAPC